MRWNLRLLLVALLLFCASAGVTLVSLERESQPLAVLALVGMGAAAVLFLLSVWLPRRKVDWQRVEAEQRLWESGPLGRKWLRTRQRLYRKWKL